MRERYIPDEVPEELWHILEEVQGETKKLLARLAEMDRAAMVRFCWNYAEAAAYLREYPYLEFADPLLSDDGVADLANWIVAQGRETYAKIYDTPEQMPQGIKPDPGLLGAAIDHYQQRFGESLPWNSGGFVHPPGPDLPEKDG